MLSAPLSVSSPVSDIFADAGIDRIKKEANEERVGSKITVFWTGIDSKYLMSWLE